MHCFDIIIYQGRGYPHIKAAIHVIKNAPGGVVHIPNHIKHRKMDQEGGDPHTKLFALRDPRRGRSVALIFSDKDLTLQIGIVCACVCVCVCVCD